jgi:hypothetical protein
MIRIGEGIGLGRRGQRTAARRVFAEVWNEIGPAGDPFHRCALAHSMADVQDDAAEELAWNLRALEAADEITGERAREIGVAAYYPSLHLDLGDVYRRLGDPRRAREHLARGRAALGDLADDGYAQMVRGELDRLACRLANHDEG